MGCGVKKENRVFLTPDASIMPIQRKAKATASYAISQAIAKENDEAERFCGVLYASDDSLKDANYTSPSTSDSNLDPLSPVASSPNAHKSYAFGFLVVNGDEGSEGPLRFNVRPDCDSVYSRWLLVEAEKVARFYAVRHPKSTPTPEEQARFEAATACYMCGGPFWGTMVRGETRRFAITIICSPLASATSYVLLATNVTSIGEYPIFYQVSITECAEIIAIQALLDASMSNTPSPSAWDKMKEELLRIPSPHPLASLEDSASHTTSPPTTPFPDRPVTPPPDFRDVVHPPSPPRPGPPPPATTYRQFRCMVCGEVGHITFRCGHFAPLTPQERWSLVRREGRCANCLSAQHADGVCASKKRCAQCGRAHHTMLHLPDGHFAPSSSGPHPLSQYPFVERCRNMKRPAPLCQSPPDHELFRRRRPNRIPAGYEAPSPMPGLPRFPPPSPALPPYGHAPMPRMEEPLIPCSPVHPQSPPPANPWWSEDPLHEFGFERFFPRTPPPLRRHPLCRQCTRWTRAPPPPPEHLWNRHITDWEEFDPFTPRRFRPPIPPHLITFSPPGSPVIQLEPEEVVEVRPRGRGFPAYESPPPNRPSYRPGPSDSRERLRTLARGSEAIRLRESSRARFSYVLIRRG
ncbi:unnamed protein product [Bemisia tabaci]|uniref:CCHC-type domain-containing protein n=1 Tax=Bemisia tabaci TaxID=7038 RepID=A0A9P0ADF3_BEMTA|nr:unnamed protein product [Bemisia tabaci]